MKRVFKSSTFWFVVIAVITVYLNASGNDDKNLILGISNVPLIHILNKTIFPLNGRDVTQSLYKQKMFIWYGSQIISYAFYGFIVDIIRILIRKSKIKI